MAMAPVKKSKTPKVIPFGKYKGQPVEALTQDREYTDWLMGQAWFRERYANYYTLIVNNFGEAAETPEHNAAQAEFLDEGFCRSFLDVVMPADQLLDFIREPIATRLKLLRWSERRHQERIAELQKSLDEMERAVHAVRSGDRAAAEPILSLTYVRYGNPYPSTQDLLQHIADRMSQTAERRDRESVGLAQTRSSIQEWECKQVELPRAKFTVRFEVNGWDVALDSAWTAQGIDFSAPNIAHVEATDMTNRDFTLERVYLVEIKPSLSDDYPAVLRQMRSLKSAGCVCILLIGQYQGKGATLDQVRRIFQTSDIRVVLRSEIGSTALPGPCDD
jgi:hypothetical protein